MTAVDNAFRDTAQAGIDLVLGLGASGYSCVQFLSRQGRDLRVADSRLEPPYAMKLQNSLPDVDVNFGGFDNELLEQVSRIIVSPGIGPNESILLEATRRYIPIVSDIELFANVAPAPIIAITGSNGKSTVTTWIARVLELAGYDCCAGGNLGVPALDLLNQEIPDYYILELSSFQLERTSNLHLKIGVILNIGIDHIDYHGSVLAYQLAKWRLFRHCETAVLLAQLQNAQHFQDSVNTERTSTVFYGAGGTYHLSFEPDAIPEHTENWICKDGEKLLPTSVLKVVGHHNHLNALAVLAVAQSCGLQWVEIVEGLTSFTGLDHRMKWIGESHGVTWINDSKGTNVDAAIAAVLSLSSPVILIAGGEGKDASFEPLADAISSSTTRLVVLLGADAQRMAIAIGTKVEIEHAQDLDHAVQIAAREAQVGETVLLSPACASFDMFDNYQHRGDSFVRAWRALT